MGYPVLDRPPIWSGSYAETHAAETAVSVTGCPLLRTIKYNFYLGWR